MGTCDTCQHWDMDFGPERDNDNMGEVSECRRYPPFAEPHMQFIDTERITWEGSCAGNETTRFSWPVTAENHWCGEYKKRSAQDMKRIKDFREAQRRYQEGKE